MTAKDKKEALHNEHKKRLRARFLEQGGESFYDHEILEMLLSYAIVRGNTNEIAHRLINNFGSLDGVFEASYESLLKIDGVGEKSATIIKMQYELFRTYETSKYKIKNEICTTEKIVKYLAGLFFRKKHELLYMVCVDNRDRVIKNKFIFAGVKEIPVALREIISEVIATNASGVILAHNHPNGILKASEEDIYATKVIEKSLNSISVELIDHFIFCDNEHLSILNNHSFTVIKREETIF